MESQPQNPEFRNNSENFHPCACNHVKLRIYRIVPVMTMETSLFMEYLCEIAMDLNYSVNKIHFVFLS